MIMRMLLVMPVLLSAADATALESGPPEPDATQIIQDAGAQSKGHAADIFDVLIDQLTHC